MRLLPLTVALFVTAPISGRLTSRVPLRYLLSLGLALIGAGLLLMRAVDADVGVDGAAARASSSAARASASSPPRSRRRWSGVLSEAKTGLASGVNNTFRQLGIAVGIAALGAIFQHRLGAAPEQVVPASARGGLRLGTARDLPRRARSSRSRRCR